MILKLTRLSAAAALLSAGMAGAASAATLEVTFTNNQAADGVYITPLLTILHDGSFDTFDRNRRASAELEALAEEGDVSGVRGLADAAGATTGVITGPAGFGSVSPQPPVFDPGESASITLDVDPASNRFFSFLAMVIPSNDTFIGNARSMAYEVFDSAGAFTGLGPIEVYSNRAWDAGTEANDGLGAPFNANMTGMSTDTDERIRRLGNLFFLNGEETVAGTTISLSGRSLLGTIEISDVSAVPLPAGLPLLIGGLGAFGWMRRRQRTRG